MIYEFLQKVGRPVDRAELAAKFKLSDRHLRTIIAQEREQGKTIINRQDGQGYYADQCAYDIAIQLHTTQARLNSLSKACRALRAAYGKRKQKEMGKPVWENLELF